MDCETCGQPLPKKATRKVWWSANSNLTCTEQDDGLYWVENGHWTLQRFSNGYLVVETDKVVVREPDWVLISETPWPPLPDPDDDDIPF